MEEKHQASIRSNFSSLVEQTDLDLMVSALYEKGVFSDAMTEPYRETSKDTRTRKRLLYRDITRRGPEAFSKLLEALSENGYWDLVRDLDPNSCLRLQNSRSSQKEAGDSSFLSLRRNKPGREKNDPNRNWTSPESSPSSSFRSEQENNGNPAAEEYGPVDEAEQTIPQFNVIKSTKFFEVGDNGISLYRTRGRNRGVLVLFSYITYRADLEKYRRGANVDATNLRYLFSELGFKVLSYSNLSRSDTEETLSNLKFGICGDRPETVFIVFSSHGYQRYGSGDYDIRCSDNGLISFTQIMEYFSNDKFTALAGVPKVFIFQSCRGSNRVHPLPALGGVPHDGAGAGSSPPRRAEPLPSNRTYSDILIAHSTLPGYVSSRDPKLGSWYIQALCTVFAAQAHARHVEDLFKLVDERLRTDYMTQTSSVEQWGFNRRLYLHPGLYED